MWEQLTKKGYEITNKRVLGNPAYTSEQTKHKDLVQELALVQDWLIKEHDIVICFNIYNKDGSLIINIKNGSGMLLKEILTNFDINERIETKKQAVKYIINNLI